MEQTVTLYNACRMLTQRLIQLTPVYGEKGLRYFVVDRPFDVQLSNNLVITIPEGFKTDLSSVPRWLWSFAAPYGDFLLAAIIHDYLYVTNTGTRKDADKEMLLWSTVINGNLYDNFLRFLAVRWFGRSWWNRATARIQSHVHS